MLRLEPSFHPPNARPASKHEEAVLVVILLFLLSLGSSNLWAGPPDTLWTRFFGVPDLRSCSYSVRQTPDGGFVIAGWTNAWYLSSDNFWDVVLLRLDPAGNEIWRRTYGGRQEDWGNSVRVTPDGGFVIAGKTNSFGPDKSYWQACVIKTDSLGSLLWEKTYGGGALDQANCIELTSDAGYILVGAVSSRGDSAGDIWLMKLDLSGDVIWEKTYGAAGMDVGYSVQETADGGFIVAGTSAGIGGSSRAYIVKTDTQGFPVWDRVLGGMEGRSVRQTHDGGYVLAGWTEADMYLARLNAAGSLLWEKLPGNPGDGLNDRAYAVEQTPDGGFVVGGWTEHFWNDFCLVKTDSLGNQLWLKDVGKGYIDIAYDGCLTADEGYVLTGWSESFDTLGTIYVVRFGSMGGIAEQAPRGSRPGLQVYPNPTSGQVRITCNLSSIGGKPSTDYIGVYDVTGALVRMLLPRTERRNGGSDRNCAIWDGRDEEGNLVPEGAYSVFAEDHERRCSVKVVLLR